MKKQDIAIVVLLFLALLGWMLHQNRVGRARLQTAAEAQRPAAAAEPLSEAAAASAALTAEPPAPAAGAAPAETAAPAEAERLPEQVATLKTAEMAVTLSSRGGAVSCVTLARYHATREASSGPVVFDFAGQPALRWEGLPGLPADAGGTGAVLTARSPAGLEVERRISLHDRYRIAVTDRLRNGSEQPLAAATNWVSLGVFRNGTSKNDTLGADAFGAGPGDKAKVRHFERDIARALGGGGGFGCFGGGAARQPNPQATIPADGPWQWVAVKSRFFTQVLLPRTECAGFRIGASAAPAGEKRNPVGSVAAAAAFAGFTLQPGETLERSAVLYVGPKRLATLASIGPRVDEVMEFGTFKWFCKLLVPTLNFFYRVIPSYGVAIILLTILVRVIFWPLTHKSTESMKRMQTLQPQLKALQAQHKDNPQKLQQETWRIYRENKVNPLSSCLPMLFQIPIFIALYTVLRSAVELRFAPFLWIGDLSEPENLLAGVLPLPLNILPILMAATMGLQSYLTPSMGDPAQQKMMMVLMPGMMLFMFYSMPAALSLYWTVSQVISILQMLLQRYRTKAAQGGGGSGAMIVEAPAAMTRQMRRHQAPPG